MAIMDNKLEFSDAQALGAITSGASVVSTDVADLGANGLTGWGAAKTMDIGEGGALDFNVSVDTALVGASAALDCKLVAKAADASISSGGTVLATLQIPAVSVAGTMKSVKVPAGTVYRYLGVLFTASGANLTSATMNAWIGMGHRTVGF